MFAERWRQPSFIPYNQQYVVTTMRDTEGHPTGLSMRPLSDPWMADDDDNSSNAENDATVEEEEESSEESRSAEDSSEEF
jgi:hypothetical protein